MAPSYLASMASALPPSLRLAGRRAWRLVADRLAWRRLAGGLLPLLLAGLLLVGYQVTSLPVTLVVDGQPRQVNTHQATVAGLLREAGLRLDPPDRVVPPPDTRLAPGSVVRVQFARPVTIEADGRRLELRTQRQRVADILAEAGLRIKPGDVVIVDGRAWDLEADVPQAILQAPARRGPGLASAPVRSPPLRILVQRAVPMVLIDDGVPVTLYTTQPTVGEALLEQGILLYLGDQVTPSLGSRLLPGMRVYILRSTPVTLHSDGRTLRTRTQAERVGQVLAQEGLALVGRDYSQPPPDAPISADMTIQVFRVREALEIEQEIIPFETEWIADPAMRLDTQQLVQAGGEGVIKRRYRVTYRDGQQVSRVMEDDWVDRLPGDKIISYGTQVVVQMLETPEGNFEYWRRFRVLATSYSAATAGVAEDAAHYGITRTGLKAGFGVVAVDPKVIPLGSQVYVPGYGLAVAGDTGGSIVGRHIDLGFDEETPPAWYRWIDVYLLTPVPPANQIRYVLPNWPQEPRR